MISTRENRIFKHNYISEFTITKIIDRRIYGRHAQKVDKAKRKARAHAKEPTGREARKQAAPTRNILGVLYEEWVPEVYGTVRNSIWEIE